MTHCNFPAAPPPRVRQTVSIAGAARPPWLASLCAIVFALHAAPAAAQSSPPSRARANAQSAATRAAKPDPATAPGPAATADPAAPAPQADAGGDPMALPSRAMTRFWELEPQTKRGTFRLLPYNLNYLMPVTLTSRVNRQPSSPTHGDSPAMPGYRHAEAMMQISFRIKLLQDMGLPQSDLWFGFTQRAVWQAYDRKDSSPFRSVDYEPELFYVVPVPRAIGQWPGGVRLRMVQLGIAHQSNGQSAPQSRSWNRFWAGAALDRGDLALEVKLNHRFNESSNDDNPDLTHRYGDTEFRLLVPHGRALSRVQWRTRARSPSPAHGSIQYEWSLPVSRDSRQGLRWYVQLFHGNGPTMLDYNHRQTMVGVGLAVFQF